MPFTCATILLRNSKERICTKTKKKSPLEIRSLLKNAFISCDSCDKYWKNDDC